MSITRITFPLFVSLAVLTVACGPSARTSARVNPQSNEYQHVAARSNEPRTNDPTAAAPAPAQPTGTGAPATAASAPSTIGTATTTTTTSTTTATTTTTAAPANEDPAAVPKKIGARHVLIQWMGADKAPSAVVRSKDQALSLAQEVHRRAKAGEDFARLAVEYSDEPGAGNRGGSLGRFSKGQMVPQFEAIAFKLKVGEVSEIVETGFGYHVILRTE